MHQFGHLTARSATTRSNRNTRNRCGSSRKMPASRNGIG